MFHNKLLQTLQKLIPNKKIDKKFIGDILGADSKKMWAREKSNYFYKEDELKLIEDKLGVSLSAVDDCINIPVRGNVNSSMGYGITVYDESQTATYSISSQLAKDLGININNSEMIFGTGNSMEPTIKGGDALLVDLSKKDVNDGKIYCIRHDGELKTKRLQKISKTKIKIISDNKDYDPILIDFEKDISVDFEVIGEVRWCGRIFL